MIVLSLIITGLLFLQYCYMKHRTMEVLLYKNVACIFLMFTNKLDKHYHLSTHIFKQTTVHVTKTAEHKMDTIGGGVQVQRLLK